MGDSKGEKKNHLHFVAFQLSLLDVGRNQKSVLMNVNC